MIHVSGYIATSPVIAHYEHISVYSVDVSLSIPPPALSPNITIITVLLPQQLSLLYCHLSLKKLYRTIDHYSVFPNMVEETLPQENWVCANLWVTCTHLKAKAWQGRVEFRVVVNMYSFCIFYVTSSNLQ